MEATNRHASAPLLPRGDTHSEDFRGSFKAAALFGVLGVAVPYFALIGNAIGRAFIVGLEEGASAIPSALGSPSYLGQLWSLSLALGMLGFAIGLLWGPPKPTAKPTVVVRDHRRRPKPSSSSAVGGAAVTVAVFAALEGFGGL